MDWRENCGKIWENSTFQEGRSCQTERGRENWEGMMVRQSSDEKRSSKRVRVAEVEKQAGRLPSITGVIDMWVDKTLRGG
jgi:RNA polymerase subunit RPABC4/transcription elongation factor Spt4